MRAGQGIDDTVPVVITTYPNRQDKVSAITSLNTVCAKPVYIRIVDIPEDKE